MRQDAKTLLDRLDRQQLNYRDFTAAAEEIELWPLFQALLRDPRIVGNREQPEVTVAASAQQSPAQQSPAPAEATPSAASEPTPAPAAPEPAPLRAPAPLQQHPAAALFGRYGRETEPQPEVSEPPREPDLRNFLHQLGKRRA